MNALSLSICSRETSRSAVEGTPSSSICAGTGGRGERDGQRTPLAARVARNSREKKRDARRRRSPRATPSSSPRPRWVFETHLETRLLQRHEPARAPLPGLVHLPVGALPNLLELLIRFVDAVAHRERRRLSRDSFYLRARVSHGVRAASVGARVDVRDDEACGRSCGRSSRCGGPLAGLRAFVFSCREPSRFRRGEPGSCVACV